MILDVVIVNYRSGLALARSLQTARTFAGAGARLLVVDNSPGDGAVAAARVALPDLDVIENDSNRGFAAAVNQAFRAGSSPFVLLVNPDVSSIGGDIESVEGIFASDPRVAAVGVRLRNEDGSVQPTARREPRPVDLLVDSLSLRSRFQRSSWPRRAFQPEPSSGMRLVDTVFGACLFIRRAALEDVGPFDERFFVYAEETDWLVRAKRKGWRTVFTAEVEAVHALRGSTDASSEELSLLLLESNYLYSYKHIGVVRTLALRGTLVGIDSARWLRAALLGSAKQAHRKSLERRLALHVRRLQRR